MPQKDPRAEQLSTLRRAILTFRKRTECLQREQASLHEWRHLQFDALRAYLDGQRGFLAVQSMMLTAVKADRQVHRRQRNHALDLFASLSVLHDLMRSIDNEIVERDPHNG